MHMSAHQSEVAHGQRFEFGANWARFLEVLDADNIRIAENALIHMLELENLKGKSFLDVGSGSGLFSLAARRLGARVHSFDYDPQSVACTTELKKRYFRDDTQWRIEEASVLDRSYLDGLGKFDLVYSWGVLHHTGAMWQALENVVPLIKKEGKLFIAIYNDQGRKSRLWLKVKQAYNILPGIPRRLMAGLFIIRFWGPTMVRDFIQMRPFYTWRHYAEHSTRGMDPWRDVLDWLGGLPFEVAAPEKVFDFFRERSFQLIRLKTCAGGYGCNEYVFIKTNDG
jgi:2-polyprenyl-3-methyl-5-hydroxy-6-metoxy-1,4-benzoquinol methylase